MLRIGPLPFVLVASLSGWVAAAPDKPTPTPTPKATPSPKKPKDAPKRVFTNDDLEAGRDKPSKVQDASATGGATRWEEPPTPPPEPQPESTEPADTRTEEQRRIDEVEAQVKGLDDQAKQLLWAYLQSTDTNEILRLKAEQQEVLDQLEVAKAELARLKGQAASGEPTPTPTPPPG